MNAQHVVFLCIVLINYYCLFGSTYADDTSGCTKLMNDEMLPNDPVDALQFSVKCGGSYAELEWTKKSTSVELIRVEYSCYNLTSGETNFGTIESGSELDTDKRSITILENEQCKFFGCVHEYDSIFDLLIWKMNIQSVNCSYEDPADQDFVVLSPVSSSSVINEAVSYSPLSHLVQSSSFPSNNSSQPPYYLPITQTTSVHTSLSSSKSSSPSVASQGVFNSETDSSPTVSTGNVVLPIVVVILAGIAVAVLIVVCFSYRKWIKRTTSVHYEYEVKQELSHQIKSVSYYSIDNISTTGSAVTVLHSLTIKHSYEEQREKEEAISKPIKIESLDLSNDKYKEDDVSDTTSDCSTVVLHSPTSLNGVTSSSCVVGTETSKRLPSKQKFDPVTVANAPFPIVKQPIGTQTNVNGYLQDSTQSDTSSSSKQAIETQANVDGYLQDSTQSDTFPIAEQTFKTQANVDGYLQDSTQSDTFPIAEQNVETQANVDGYLQDRTQMEAVPPLFDWSNDTSISSANNMVLSGQVHGQLEDTKRQRLSSGEYISGDAQRTDQSNLTELRRVPTIPSHLVLLESTSDYVSGASSCSTINSNYLQSPCSNVFTPTESETIPYILSGPPQKVQNQAILMSDTTIDLCDDIGKMNSDHHSSLLPKLHSQSTPTTSPLVSSNGYIANEPIRNLCEEIDKETPAADGYIDSCSHTEELNTSGNYLSSLNQYHESTTLEQSIKISATRSETSYIAKDSEFEIEDHHGCPPQTTDVELGIDLCDVICEDNNRTSQDVPLTVSLPNRLSDVVTPANYIPQAVTKQKFVVSRIPGDHLQDSHEPCVRPETFHSEEIQMDLCETDYYDNALGGTSSSSQLSTQPQDYLSSPSFTQTPIIKTLGQESHSSSCSSQTNDNYSRMDIVEYGTSIPNDNRIPNTSPSNNSREEQSSDFIIDLCDITTDDQGSHGQFLDSNHNCFDVGYFNPQTNQSTVKQAHEDTTRPALSSPSTAAVHDDYILAETPCQDKSL